MDKVKFLKELWLNSNKVPKYLKDQLSAQSHEELNIAFNHELEFGTAGFRSTLNAGDGYMNVFTIRKATLAYAQFLKKINPKKKLKVIIGFDNRHFSNEFCHEARKVLQDNGIEVYLIKDGELRPTPFISYCIRKHKLDGGIIITASHNPKIYNGYKVYGNTGTQLLPKDTNVIAKNMKTIGSDYYKKSLKNPKSSFLEVEFKGSDSKTKYIPETTLQIYFKEIIKRLVKKDNIRKEELKYTFTALSGTSHKVLPELMNQAGYKKITIVKEQCYPDPDFRNTPNPNPENIEAFDLAIKYAEKADSKLILAIDPDADRLGVMVKNNHHWIPMSGNEMAILYLNYLIKAGYDIKNGYIVRSYVSTDLVDIIAAKHKIKVYTCPTGFKWICNEINKHEKGNFLLGFEEAVGAILLDINRDKDSLQSSILTCEMVNYYSRKYKNLIDVLDDIYQEYGYHKSKTVAKVYTDLNWKAKVHKIIENLKKYDNEKIGSLKIVQKLYDDKNEILRFNFDDKSWVAFRASGTEPKLKFYLYIYAKNKIILNATFDQMEQAIAKLIE